MLEILPLIQSAPALALSQSGRAIASLVEHTFPDYYGTEDTVPYPSM